MRTINRTGGSWIVVATLVAAACSTTAGSEGESDSDPSAFEQLVAELDEDVVPLDTALQAFALAIGSLPGVEIPEGRRELIPSASGALRWVRGHWDELSAEQQAAVDRYVRGEANDAVGSNSVILAVAAVPILTAADDDVDSLALLGLIEQDLAKLSTRLGRPLGIPVELQIAPKFVDGDGAMFARPVDASGGWSGTPVKCVVTVGKLGIDVAQQIDSAGVASTELESFVAHELFHCYSYTVGNPALWPQRPAWVMEGMAEWAGESISGGTTDSAWWKGWLLGGTASLFKRTYSGVGFWSHLDEHGGLLWATALDIMAASDAGSDSAYAAAVATGGPDMVTAWGPGYFRDPQYAPTFDQNGPGIPNVKPDATDHGAIGSGGSATMTAPVLAAATHQADLSADVITISAPGAGMVQFPDGVIATLPAAEVLCTEPGGCQCPDGSPGIDTIFRQTIPGQARAGLSGHLQGSELTITGWALEDFCENPPVPACMIGNWLSEEYRAAGQAIIGGLATMSMIIDRTGRGEAVFDPEVPINARIDEPGLTPWVKMVFSGRYNFTVTANGTAGEVLNGNASLDFFVFNGGWIPGESTSLVTGPGRITSTFICTGDRLIARAPGGVSEFEFSRVDD